MRWTKREKGREAGRETDREKSDGERETESDVTLSREWTLVDTVTPTDSSSSTHILFRNAKKASSSMIPSQKEIIYLCLVLLKRIQMRVNAGNRLTNCSTTQVNQ